MFVITADQIDSRTDTDRVPDALQRIDDLRDRLLLRPARFAGDELQFVTDSADVALETVLRLTRLDHWSVGLGVGGARTPLPADAAAASGPVFIRAREAVEQAKRSTTHFALVATPAQDLASPDSLGALVDLLLTQRARRSDEGWAVCDLLDAGATQASVAERLGITPQAVSLRVKAAGWRLETRARPGLVVLLNASDRAATAADVAS